MKKMVIKSLEVKTLDTRKGAYKIIALKPDRYPDAKGLANLEALGFTYIRAKKEYKNGRFVGYAAEGYFSAPYDAKLYKSLAKQAGIPEKPAKQTKATSKATKAAKASQPKADTTSTLLSALADMDEAKLALLLKLASALG